MTAITSETWTGSNGASWPAQWTTGLTPTGGSATIQSNRGRLVTGTVAGNFNGSNRVSRRISTSAADVVILASFIYDSIPGTNRTACYPRFYVRSQSNSIDGQGGYYIELSGVDNAWEVGQAISFSGGAMTNTVTGNATAISKTFVAGTKYWVRFGVVGSAIKARVWDDGNSEPSSWQWESTDSGITGSKPYGMTIGHGVGQCYVEFDDFASDTAFPAAPVTGTSALTTGTALAATGDVAKIGAGALTTGTALAAGGLTTEIASGALSVATSLAASATAAQFAGAGLSTGTALAAAGAPTRFGDAALTTGTALAASGAPSPASGLGLSVATALTAAGSVLQLAQAALTTPTTLGASGLSGKTGTAALVTGTVLSASASVARLAGAGLSVKTELFAEGASFAPPEPQRGRYKVFVRRADLSLVGEVDDFLTLNATKVYNDVGSWELSISSASPNADLLDPALNPSGGIIILRDGVTFLTGPIDAFSDNWSDEDGENDVITVSGTDDNLWLFGSLVYPNPAQTPEVMTTSYYRTASLAAESIMRDLVLKNLGSSALAPRQLDHLVVPASLSRGKVQKSPKYRFDVLGIALQQLSVLSQVGSDVTTQLMFSLQQEGLSLVFRVTNGAGKASEVKFSKRLGTLRSYERTSQAPTATNLILGAGSEETPDDSSGVKIAKGLFSYERTDLDFPRRIEQFVDVGVIDPSNADTPLELAELQEQLDQQAEDAFDSGSGQIGATLVPRETSQLAFGLDYSLGDFCTVILPRLTFVERIREVDLTFEVGTGETITVSVGTTEGSYQRRTRGAYRRISTLKNYIDRLKTGK